MSQKHSQCIYNKEIKIYAITQKLKTYVYKCINKWTNYDISQNRVLCTNIVYQTIDLWSTKLHRFWSHYAKFI